jgi:hypothetical protein
MRPRFILTLALSTAGCWISASDADAQQGRRPGSAPGGRAYPRVVEPEADLLRPYASRPARLGGDSRYGYRAAVRPETAPRPAGRSRGVQDYYPAMRTGQGPNRNTVDPRSLCVPGRRALLLPMPIPNPRPGGAAGFRPTTR